MRAASMQFGYFGGSLAAGAALALGGYAARGATVGALFLSAALLLGRLPAHRDVAGALTSRSLLALYRAPRGGEHQPPAAGLLGASRERARMATRKTGVGARTAPAPVSACGKRGLLVVASSAGAWTFGCSAHWR
jgi:hypothetical protein